MTEGRLAGKRAIVTGAASGIGRASTLLFAAEGASVIAVDRDADGLEATLEALGAGRSRVTGVTADTGSELDVRRSVDTCIGAHGGVDVLFANAGISGRMESLAELTVETWTEVLRVNLIGTFLAIREVVPHMRAQGAGSIVCTASVAGIRSGAGPAPYSASKAGVINLVQTLANELYGTGIRLNAVCPGLIETGMTRPLFEHARSRGTEDRIGQLNPLTRYGHPGEIAELALFLASDAASYVNGQAIAADGGLTSTLPFAPSRRGF